MRHRSSIITKGSQVLGKNVSGRQSFMETDTYVATHEAATEASDPRNDADHAFPGAAGAT